MTDFISHADAAKQLGLTRGKLDKWCKDHPEFKLARIFNRIAWLPEQIADVAEALQKEKADAERAAAGICRHCGRPWNGDVPEALDVVTSDTEEQA